MDIFKADDWPHCVGGAGMRLEETGRAKNFPKSSSLGHQVLRGRYVTLCKDIIYDYYLWFLSDPIRRIRCWIQALISILWRRRRWGKSRSRRRERRRRREGGTGGWERGEPEDKEDCGKELVGVSQLPHSQGCPLYSSCPLCWVRPGSFFTLFSPFWSFFGPFLAPF